MTDRFYVSTPKSELKKDIRYSLEVLVSADRIKLHINLNIHEKRNLESKQWVNYTIIDSALNLLSYQFPELQGLQSCQLAHQLDFDRHKKVQVGKDQEKAQSEKDSHSKNRGGKKPNQQSGTYTMKHIVSRMSNYFPNRWPLSYLNLTKNMKTYIRSQQHKKKKKKKKKKKNVFKHQDIKQKEPPQKYRLGTISNTKLLAGLNRFYMAITSPSASAVVQ